MYDACGPLKDRSSPLYQVEEWYDRSSVSQMANRSLRAPSRSSQKGSIAADHALPANRALHHRDDRESFASLLGSDTGALLNLLLHYHEVLLQHGLGAEAERLLQVAVQPEERAAGVAVPPLPGMSVLLRDGLLAYFLSINPHLPPLPPQIVKLQNATYSIRGKEAMEGVDTFASKVHG